MSRIYFHSPTATKEIYGPERSLMRVVCDDVALSAFMAGSCDIHKWLPMYLPRDASPLSALKEEFGCIPRFEKSLSYWMSDGKFIIDGRSYNAWEMSLNTVLAIGNDALKLYARLHGQCEIHTYVEGPNRDWLATIIDRGVECGLYRNRGYLGSDGKMHYEDQWSKLAEFLRSRDDEPVVTSYSVCSQFPNRELANWEDDHDGDKWYDESNETKWKFALDGLRKNNSLELNPDNWETYRFSHLKDLFWLIRINQEREDAQIASHA